MRRAFYTPRIPEAEGVERSQELALALAQTADPEFIEAIIHLKSMLDRIGGQVYIAAYRNKYDPNTGAVLEDPRAPGRHETDGYAFHYEHIAKLTNAPREPDQAVERLSEVRDDEGWTAEPEALEVPEEELSAVAAE